MKKSKKQKRGQHFFVLPGKNSLLHLDVFLLQHTPLVLMFQYMFLLYEKECEIKKCPIIMHLILYLAYVSTQKSSIVTKS